MLKLTLVGEPGNRGDARYSETLKEVLPSKRSCSLEISNTEIIEDSPGRFPPL